MKMVRAEQKSGLRRIVINFQKKRTGSARECINQETANETTDDTNDSGKRDRSGRLP